MIGRGPAMADLHHLGRVMAGPGSAPAIMRLPGWRNPLPSLLSFPGGAP